MKNSKSKANPSRLSTTKQGSITDRLNHTASIVVSNIQKQMQEKENVINRLDRLADYSHIHQNIKNEQDLCMKHYGRIEDQYRKNKFDPHHKNFQKSAKQCDEMYLNAVDLMQSLSVELDEKNQMIAKVQNTINQRNRKLTHLTDQYKQMNNDLQQEYDMKNDSKNDNVNEKLISLKKDVSRL